jgi:hypothetical protein
VNGILIIGRSNYNEEQLATNSHVLGVIKSLEYDIDLLTVTSVTRYMFVHDKVMFVKEWGELA